MTWTTKPQDPVPSTALWHYTRSGRRKEMPTFYILFWTPWDSTQVQVLVSCPHSSSEHAWLSSSTPPGSHHAALSWCVVKQCHHGTVLRLEYRVFVSALGTYRILPGKMNFSEVQYHALALSRTLRDAQPALLSHTWTLGLGSVAL